MLLVTNEADDLDEILNGFRLTASSFRIVTVLFYIMGSTYLIMYTFVILTHIFEIKKNQNIKVH